MNAVEEVDKGFGTFDAGIDAHGVGKTFIEEFPAFVASDNKQFPEAGFSANLPDDKKGGHVSEAPVDDKHDGARKPELTVLPGGIQIVQRALAGAAKKQRDFPRGPKPFLLELAFAFRFHANNENTLMIHKIF